MRRHLAALSAALLLLGLTACSPGGVDPDVNEDPAAALSAAVAALGDLDGVEVTLALDVEDEEAFAGSLDADERALLLGSDIMIRGIGGGDDRGATQIIVRLQGREAAEVRVIDQAFYFQVDLGVIGSVVDDPQFENGIEEAISAASMLGLGDVARAIADGGWIELTGLEELAELGGAAPEEPSEEEIVEVQARIVAAVQRFVDEDVNVEVVGSDDLGTRVRATSSGAAINRLFEEISGIASDLGGVDLDEFGAGEVTDVIPPNEQVSIDAWIADGRLVQIGFDLGGVDDEVPAGTFVVLRITEFTGNIDAPNVDTTLDLMSIFGMFLGGLDDFGGAPGVDGTPGGASAACIPQDVLDAQIEAGDEAFAEQIEAALEQGILEVC